MANKKLEQGLNGLLNPTPQEQTQEQEQTTTKAKKVYKAVCYNLHPDIIEKVKYIAYYDRKRVNEVVTEALTEYFSNWKPAKQEAPKKL
jgi:hypothetical protein